MLATRDIAPMKDGEGSLGTEKKKWKELWVENINGGKADSIPVGVILPYGANGDIPSGYLLCDGAAYSRAMFPDLFANIGTTHGAGDGSTTFNVPDYNQAKRFVQGSTVAGTVKSAGLPNITGAQDTLNGSTGTPGTWSQASTGAFYNDGPNCYNDVATQGVSYDRASHLKFDASRSNPIYGASNTVQPPALTARFIIKAFDRQTADSALIDITQYANALAGKADRDLSNLTAAGEAKITSLPYKHDFTIIYPNGGSEASPANVTIGSTYVESNPFPGYYVATYCEIKYTDGKWYAINWQDAYGNGSHSGGVWSYQDYTTDSVVVKTGSQHLLDYPSWSAGTLPCRVKVWKIGKIPIN